MDRDDGRSSSSAGHRLRVSRPAEEFQGLLEVGIKPRPARYAMFLDWINLAASTTGGARRGLRVKDSKQVLIVLVYSSITFPQAFDFPGRMKNRCMIASPKRIADFRQAVLRQLFG